MRKRQAKTERTVGVPPWLLPLLHKNEAVGELCSLTKSPGLPVLLFLTWMASSSGSYAAGLAHSWSVESCPPPPLLAPCLLQPKRGTAARGMWPHGLLVSSRWVTKACSGSSCLLSSFFFGCLLVLVSSETLLSHSARSAFLTLVIKDGYRSSAVLAFPWPWLMLWAIFPSSASHRRLLLSTACLTLNWEEEPKEMKKVTRSSQILRLSEEGTAVSARDVSVRAKRCDVVLVLIAARPATSRTSLSWAVSETKWRCDLPPRTRGGRSFPGPGEAKSMWHLFNLFWMSFC